MMGDFPHPAAGTALSLAIAALLLASLSGQVLHGYLRIMHAPPSRRVYVGTYETALLVHLLAMAALAMHALSPGGVGAGAGLPLPFDIMLWVNAAVAIVALYILLAGLGDEAEPDGTAWMPAVEALLACLCTPLALELLGEAAWAVLLADAAYFAARMMVLLVFDSRNRRKIVSPLSATEAVKHLPEGIMYADEFGRPIMANNSMRRLLGKIGIVADSTNARELWYELEAKAADPRHSVPPGAVAREPGAWVIVRLDESEVRLFSFEGSGWELRRRYPAARPLVDQHPQVDVARDVLGSTPYFRVIAYDVSEEINLIAEIGRTNDELEAAQRTLQASAEEARAAAENEAMLKMRGRVHDVIGQRLSLLHRALEDNAISDERLAQLKPLLNGILDDLSAETSISPADNLAATVDAFALSGVAVIVEGSLPADKARAELFANCIREAVTNAVKHALASEVRVQMDERSLVVRNAGTPAVWPIAEGTGLSHMRRTIEAAGGSLSFDRSPFTVRVSLPASFPTGA